MACRSMNYVFGQTSPIEVTSFWRIRLQRSPYLHEVSRNKMSAHKIFTWVLQSMFITPTLIEATNNGRQTLLGCLKTLPLLSNSLNKEIVGGRGGRHGEKVFTFCWLENYDFSTCKGFLWKKMALSYIFVFLIIKIIF